MGITLVLDANVWFDLQLAPALMARVFEFDVHLVIPDLLASELRSVPVASLKSKGLEVISLDPPEVADLIRIRSKEPQLSVQDVSVFIVAKKLHAVLVTGDEALRKFSEHAKVEVHGTLWLLEQMEKSGVASPQELLDGLRTMRARGRRLPRVETDRLIKRWRASIVR